MPKTISKVLHNKLLKSEGFKQILKDLYLTSRMEALFLDEFGNECLRAPRKSSRKIRELKNRYPELNSHLTKIRQQQLSGENPVGNPFIELVYPIRIVQETVGFLVLTACRDPEESEIYGRSLWTQMAKSGVSLPWSQWKQAMDEFPMYSTDIRGAWLRTLKMKVKDAVQSVENVVNPLAGHPSLPPMILKGCERIQEEYMKPLKMSDIAQGFQVSAEHYSRLFHQSTGLRFREYLAETRIRAACELLKTTDDIISDIAEKVGYSTLSRFNKAFKEHTGTTPRSYRKRLFTPKV